jgi:uncharacterized membrane protein
MPKAWPTGVSSQRVHRVFAASVLVKGMDGALETIGGILFMFVSPKALSSLAIFSRHMNCRKIPVIGSLQRCAMRLTIYHRTTNFS